MPREDIILLIFLTPGHVFEANNVGIVDDVKLKCQMIEREKNL